jgi:hypothetical protein
LENLVNPNKSDNQNKLNNPDKPPEPDNLDDPNHPELDKSNKCSSDCGELSDYVHKDKLNNPDTLEKAGNSDMLDRRRVMSDDEYKHVSIRNIRMHLIDSNYSICSVLAIVIFIIITVTIIILIIVIISIIIVIIIISIIRKICMCVFMY